MPETVANAPKLTLQQKLCFSESVDNWNTDNVVAFGAPTPIFRTSHGCLFHGDCLEILPHIRDASIDTVFAVLLADVERRIGKDCVDAGVTNVRKNFKAVAVKQTTM